MLRTFDLSFRLSGNATTSPVDTPEIANILRNVANKIDVGEDYGKILNKQNEEIGSYFTETF